MGRFVLRGIPLLATLATASGCAVFAPGHPVVTPRPIMAIAAPHPRLVVRTHWFMPQSPVADIRAMHAPFVEPLPAPSTVPPKTLPGAALQAATLPGAALPGSQVSVGKHSPVIGTATAVSRNPWHCRPAKSACPGGKEGAKTAWWSCRKVLPGAAL
ncbi:hypothetical protein JKG47_20470, partial [Acidithiobacillus sp. MC6.1]|nr:hypothetical protein [Acidithiobacillus sp. MC6.1]